MQDFVEREKKLGIFVAVIFLLVVALPYFGDQYSVDYLTTQKRLDRNLRTEIQDFQLKLATIEDQRRLLRENREAYISWVERGAVGEQKPVDWVRQMQNIVEERKLLPPSFSFDNPVNHSSDAYPWTKDSTANISVMSMSLKMPMLHDLDMLMFLDSLDSRVGSLFFPVECDFVRLESEFTLVKQANMQADCALNWISINDPEKTI